MYNFDAARSSAQQFSHHGIPVSIYGHHSQLIPPPPASTTAPAASQLYARSTEQPHYHHQALDRSEAFAAVDRFGRHDIGDHHPSSQGQPMRRRPSLLPQQSMPSEYGYSSALMNQQYAQRLSERDRYLDSYAAAAAAVGPFGDPSKAKPTLLHRTPLGLPGALIGPPGPLGPLGSQHAGVLTHGHHSLAGLHPSIAQSHLPTAHEQEIINKRPRLMYEPKPSLSINQPLRIETQESENVKKEPAYTPQVEAISPTPNEEPQESPLKSSKDYLLQNLSRIDRDIQQTELQLSRLRRMQGELELSKSTTDKPDSEVAPDIKQQSVAQLVYSENRKKAQAAHEHLSKLNPLGKPTLDTLPLYNQPSDTAVYHENLRKYSTFKVKLIAMFKKRNAEKQAREKYLSESYDKLMEKWLGKLEKRESNPTKKAKETKLRDFFEKQFPELRKQREDKERLSRAGQRIRSDADLEEIMDGLQEQELEDKKMRSYAVIPPILIDTRFRKYMFINKNGLMEDPMAEYKERQELNKMWTDQEKDIFREKFLLHPKNFGLISTYLERKTVSDCVQYYYLSKKSENYKQLLRKHVKKRTRALVKAQQQQAAAAAAQAANASRQNAEQATKNGLLGKDDGDSRGHNSAPMVTTDGAADAKAADGNENRLSNDASGPPSKVLCTHHCYLCKSQIEDLSKSSAVTKADSDLYRIPLADISFSTRICHSCKFNHNPNSNQIICPVPSCKTPRMKVKRLRSLPQQWHDMNPDLKRAYSEELSFPLEIQRCCFRCLMRVSRRIGAVSPSLVRPDSKKKSNNDVVWKDEEIEGLKRALKENGKNWTQAANAVSSKSIKDCKRFYYNYKYKYKLDQLIRLFNDRCGQPRVFSDADSDEYWNDISDRDSEETSSADEGNGGKSSDTTSAPSPMAKPADEKLLGASAGAHHQQGISVATSTSGYNDVSMGKLQDLKALSGSQASLKSDYDSSATMSADEGHADVGRRSVSPSLHPPRASSVSAINSNHLYPNDRHLRPSSHEMPFDDISKAQIRDHATVSSSTTRPMPPSIGPIMAQRPLVPSFLINPNAPSTNSVIRNEPEPAAALAAAAAKPDEPTCVRDLIYQAIERSLQTPAKSTSKPTDISPPPSAMPPMSSPFPVDRPRDVPPHRMTLYSPAIEVKHEPGVPPANERARAVLGLPDIHSRPTYISPIAANNSNLARPEGLAMMSYSHHLGTVPSNSSSNEDEVQDLSKKSSSLEPPRTVTPQRRPITPNSREFLNQMPPPAHSKLKPMVETPPPELLQREAAFRQAEINRLAPKQPHPGFISQDRGMPPHSLLPPQRQPPRINLPPSKSSVPPPPLVNSSIKQDRFPSLEVPGVTGSITHGTPVMLTGTPQQNYGPGPHVRYEGMLRPMTTKDAGSITLGTPVQDSLRKKQEMMLRADIKHSAASMLEISSIGSSIPSDAALLYTGVSQPGLPYGAAGRFEGLLRQVPGAGKEAGSITLGTPLQDQRKKPEPQFVRDPKHPMHAAFEQSEQFFKSRMSPNTLPPGVPHPYTPGHHVVRAANLPSHVPVSSPYGTHPNYPPPSDRALLAQQKSGFTDSGQQHLSQIMIDFNTSKQMQGRRGSISGERDRPSSPAMSLSRSRDAGSPQVLAHRMQIMGPPFSTAGTPPIASQFKAMSDAMRFASPLYERPQSASGERPQPSAWNKPSPNSQHQQQYAMMSRQNVIQQGWGKQSVIQAPKSCSPRNLEREDHASLAAAQSKLYTPSFAPSHEAFHTLVNAAAAQQSLAVPGKDDRRPMSVGKPLEPHGSRSPKDMRPSEGLERALIDAHMRPRPFSTEGLSLRPEHIRELQLREQRAVYRPGPVPDEKRWAEERELNERERAQRVRQIFSTTAESNDKKQRMDYSELERERITPTHSGIMPVNNQNSLRIITGSREPSFSKERFERELRHSDASVKQTIEDARDLQMQEHFRMQQQQLRDNEASRLFSSSFQKDAPAPKMPSARSGFTAANLIDAIITHQINQAASDGSGGSAGGARVTPSISQANHAKLMRIEQQPSFPTSIAASHPIVSHSEVLKKEERPIEVNEVEPALTNKPVMPLASGSGSRSPELVDPYQTKKSWTPDTSLAAVTAERKDQRANDSQPTVAAADKPAIAADSLKSPPIPEGGRAQDVKQKEQQPSPPSVANQEPAPTAIPPSVSSSGPPEPTEAVAGEAGPANNAAVDSAAVPALAGNNSTDSLNVNVVAS